MRAKFRRSAVLLILGAMSLLAILLFRSHPPATPTAIAMTFVGYTNLPGNNLRFALFSISNQATYPVRWYGDWVEVEGAPYHKARITNPSLPGWTRAPVLQAGGVLPMAVGEPSDDSETGRWRFAMSFSRYTWRSRWLDFSFRHKLPLRLGSIVLLDDQRILNPSNHVTVATGWLPK